MLLSEHMKKKKGEPLPARIYAPSPCHINILQADEGKTEVWMSAEYSFR